MVRYCPSCGRSIPLDAKICPYCGKFIAQHEGLIIPEAEQKKDRTLLIIAIVIALIIIVPIAIAATVYVYVISMMPEPSISTPSISFMKSDQNLTVVAADPLTKWSDIEISGIYSDFPSHLYVTAGDQITGCSGAIRIIYEPTNTLLGVWIFT